MKNQTSYLVTAVIALVVGAAAFYGGMQYQMKKMPMMGGRPMGGQMGGRMGAPARTMTGMAPVSGEIISQDDTSITVKMPDGSSKIVLLSEQTSINKSSEGSKTDLQTGEQVTAFGTQNQDGSITAQSVSIGGTMMMRGMGVQAPGATESGE